MGLVAARQEHAQRRRAVTNYARFKLDGDCKRAGRGKLAEVARALGFKSATLSNFLAERSDGSDELITALAERHWNTSREEFTEEALLWAAERAHRKTRKAS